MKQKKMLALGLSVATIGMLNAAIDAQAQVQPEMSSQTALSRLNNGVMASLTQQGTFSGKITDKNTGAALTSTGNAALVVVDGNYNLVLADGSFEIKGLSVGKHTIKFMATGYATQAKEIEIKAGETTTLDAQMSEGSSEIISEKFVGKITDKNTGVALSSTGNAALVDVDGKYNLVQADGTFEIKDLSVGKHTVKFLATGYATQSKEIEIKAGETTTLDAQMSEGTSELTSEKFVGKITDKNTGAALSSTGNSALVSVDGKYNLVQADGSFEIKNLSVGKHTVQFTAAGYATQTKEIEIKAAEITTLDAQMSEGSSEIISEKFVGKITDENTGNALSSTGNSALVSVDGKYNLVQADGSFEISNLSVGKHTVQFSANGYVTQTKEIEIKTGETTTLNAQLSAGSTVDVSKGDFGGKITDKENGAALSSFGNSALVNVDGKYYGVQADGSFDIKDLSAGKHTVKFTASDYEMQTKEIVIEGGKTVTLDAQLSKKEKPPVGTPGVISGRVKDQNTGQTLSDSKVTMDGKDYGLQADGSFEIKDVQAGDYKVTFSAPGYVSQTETVHVEAGQTTFINADLAKEAPAVTTGTLFGQVTDQLSGQTLTDAKVTVDGKDYGVQNGNYEIKDLSVGAHTVVFSAPGYASQTETIRIEAGQTTSMNKQLVKEAPAVTTGTLAGQVTDQRGQILTDAKVTVDGQAYDVQHGNYEIHDLEAGAHTVVFSAPGYTSQTETVTIVAGQGLFMNKQLVQDAPAVTTGGLRGLLTDQMGQVLPDAKVTIDGKDYSAQNGSYEIQDLEVGNHTVVFSAPGYASQTETVNIVAGQTSFMNKQLVQDAPSVTTGVLAGRITDKLTGQGIFGAKISVDGQDYAVQSDGTFEIQFLSAGTHTVVFSAPDHVSQTETLTINPGQLTQFFAQL